MSQPQFIIVSTDEVGIIRKKRDLLEQVSGPNPHELKVISLVDLILEHKSENSNKLTDPGLSYGHISPQGVAEFWKGARLVKVSKPKYHYAGKYGGGGSGGDK